MSISGCSGSPDNSCGTSSSPMPATPRTLNTSTLWYAAIARPPRSRWSVFAAVRFVADILDVIDDVIRVFLERVVDARFEIRLRAIAVNAKAAADVQILQVGGAHMPEFRRRRGRVSPPRFHLANIRDLAAEVEVEELQTIGHAPEFQLFERSA